MRRLGFLETALLYLLTCSLGIKYVESALCSKGCDLALGSYYIWREATLTNISSAFNTTNANILSYNSQIPSQDSIPAFSRINVPFSCDCLRDGNVLGRIFPYSVQKGDTYEEIATKYYSNLTTAAWIQNFNSYPASNIPDNAILNVTVNCTCGNSSVSDAYGLFITYPLRPGETLQSVATYANLSTSLLQSYNPGVNFSRGSGLVYIPARDKNGSYPRLSLSSSNSPSSGLSGGTIAGIIIGVVVGLIVVGIAVYFIRRRKTKSFMSLSAKPEIDSTAVVFETTIRADQVDRPGGIMVDKSVEFSYEELANATDNFSMAYKIGQGGFGAVFYAELNGERAAIKKMDMQASREFMAELKVLTNVHHLNLVRLIGYCIENSLCLVYEYVENGNLSQHLRGSGVDPLPWSARVQIALDSARGLEYIHEHTVPLYIHRDIKSANILLDQNFRAKVADFGLTKLTEAGTTRLVGTFGYMPPEYAQYGEVSPKVDVYAFGVVLYELISAKEAVVKQSDSFVESKGLVGMFDDVFSKPDPNEICKLIDPRLGDNYPLDAVLKMAQVARACTSEDPHLRPTMRSAAVALMALSSSTEEWDASPFYQNQGFAQHMSGR